MPFRIRMTRTIAVFLVAILFMEWTAVEGRVGNRNEGKGGELGMGRRDVLAEDYPDHFLALNLQVDSKNGAKKARGRKRAAGNAIRAENEEHQLSPRQPRVTTCVGEILTNYIWHFDMVKRTAVWEGWVSTICDANATVGDVVALSNVQSESGALINARQSSTLTTPLPGLLPSLTKWSTMRIRSPIAVLFDLRYYPFDEIWVPVTMMGLQDTTTFNLSYLSFYPELRGISRKFYTDLGIQLTASSPYIVTELVSLGTDGTLSPISDLKYAKITLWFCFTRYEYTNFVQLLLPTYLAYLISIASLFLPTSDSFDARMGILGASIFVVVLNINALSTYLGTPSAMTLGDLVNIVTLILITLIFVESIVEKWLLVIYKKAVRRGMGTLNEGGSHAVNDGEAAVRMAPEAEEEPNEITLLSNGVSNFSRGTISDSTSQPNSKEAPASDLMNPPEPSNSRRKQRLHIWPPISAFDASGHPLDELEYADRVMKLSLAMTIFSVVAYAAVNVGLLVAWRPDGKPPDRHEY